MKKLFVLLLLSITVISQKNYPQIPDENKQEQMKVKAFGGAVLIMKQNKVFMKKGCCFAGHKWNIHNTAYTKFPIGSATKQYTAACILQLIEQSKLNLDDAIGKFFPDFQKGDSVTIRMLLNHVSGITDYVGEPEFVDADRLSWNKDSIITLFKNKPFIFPPGTKWSYSNSGYFLLGYIVDKVSGQSYNDYLRQHIIDNSEIRNTCINREEGKNSVVNTEWINIGFPQSTGTGYSTVQDIYKWQFEWTRAFKGISIPY